MQIVKDFRHILYIFCITFTSQFHFNCSSNPRHKEKATQNRITFQINLPNYFYVSLAKGMRLKRLFFY